MKQILLLSGGVGGAKLVKGFVDALSSMNQDQDQAILLHVLINTADDFEHLGLYICPDIDTVSYTLSGHNNQAQGWGLENETWQAFEQLALLGAPNWFKLGDKDLATHIWRTWRLKQGDKLTQVTQAVAKALDIQGLELLPMTNDKVTTQLKVEDEQATRWLDFQEYFVKEQCQPTVSAIHYQGASTATLSAELSNLFASEALDAIIIAPSNPLLSIAPILQTANIAQLIQHCKQRIPVIAVSPLINGVALKGPTAKLMRELGMAVSAKAVAAYYCDYINGYILDSHDYALRAQIEDLSLAVHCCPTYMHDELTKRTLAHECINFALRLSNR